MKNSVIRTATKFINKSLKRKTDVNSITAYLQSIGYTVSLYEHADEENLILLHGLNEQVRIIHAFTIVDGSSKFVYVNKSLSTENKRYAILHETAHIVLGHLDSSDIIYNERLREMEAETFAYTILNPPKKNILLPIISFVLIAILSFTVGFNSVSKELPALSTPLEREQEYTKELVSETEIEQTNESEYVYITPTGKKYHRSDCRYVKGKNCTKLITDEAQKNYEPCSICKP